MVCISMLQQRPQHPPNQSDSQHQYIKLREEVLLNLLALQVQKYKS
jgi:hypothetical protein